MDFGAPEGAGPESGAAADSAGASAAVDSVSVETGDCDEMTARDFPRSSAGGARTAEES
jgi:hypothetical protein